MLNILVIHGSPHKGRTYQATMDFLKVLESRFEFSFHPVFLYQEHLEFCRGCGMCVVHGESKCPIKDGFRGIHAQMEDADVVIITTPVYALHVTGLLKNFIDRSSYIMHRPRYFGKWFMTISTQAISGDRDVAKYMANVTHFWGFNVIPGLHLKMGLDKQIIQKKINAAVDTFQSIVGRPRFTTPSLKDLMMFRIRRNVANSRGYSDEFPRDAEYFREQGWLRSSYYHDVHLNAGQRFVGWFFDVLGRSMIRNDKLDENPTEAIQAPIVAKNEGKMNKG